MPASQGPSLMFLHSSPLSLQMSPALGYRLSCEEGGREGGMGVCLSIQGARRFFLSDANHASAQAIGATAVCNSEPASGTFVPFQTRLSVHGSLEAVMEGILSGPHPDDLGAGASRQQDGSRRSNKLVADHGCGCGLTGALRDASGAGALRCC